MPNGEMTITLQYVAILLGLLVDVTPLIGLMLQHMPELYESLLRYRPEEDDMDGSRLLMEWLERKFPTLPLDDVDVAIQRYVLVHIL